MNATLLRLRNTARLEKMIRDGADYDKIVKQSKKLDKLVLKRIIEMNDIQR